MCRRGPTNSKIDAFQSSTLFDGSPLEAEELLCEVLKWASMSFEALCSKPGGFGSKPAPWWTVVDVQRVWLTDDFIKKYSAHSNIKISILRLVLIESIDLKIKKTSCVSAFVE